MNEQLKTELLILYGDLREQRRNEFDYFARHRLEDKLEALETLFRRFGILKPY